MLNSCEYNENEMQTFALAKIDVTKLKSIQNVFTGSNVKYDVASTKMVSIDCFKFLSPNIFILISIYFTQTNSIYHWQARLVILRVEYEG